MNKYTKSVSTIALLTGTLLFGNAAFAQNSSVFTDEVIVTATKRATTLQETPVAVTVTTADVIEKARILDLNDLQSVVPTLRVSQLQNSANTSLSIRGFANGTNNIGLEPSVALFIDGVYRSRAASQIGDLPVLERIEVLSGPQSTLFGKNASAGVVSIVSAKPQYETQGHVEFGYGNFNQVTAEGYVTTGLSDTLAVSLGGGFQSRDGYGEIVNLGEDINDVRNINIRAQALYEPTEEFSLRFIGDYSELDENCCITATDVFSATTAVVAGLGGQQSSQDDSFTYETFLNRNTPNSFEDWGVSAQADYDVGIATLTSITSYRENAGGFTESDSDFTSLDILGNVSQIVNLDTFTQELRLTSNDSDSRFDWMIGGFYFNENIEQNSTTSYGADTRDFVDGLLDPLNLLFIENEITNLPFFSAFAEGQGTVENFTQDNESYSLFGTVDFHVTDKLTLTGGLNYTNDDKDVTATVVNTDAFAALNLLGADGDELSPALGAALTPLVAQGVAGAVGVDPTNANVGALLAGTFGVDPVTSAQQAGFTGALPGAVSDTVSDTLNSLAGNQFFTPFVNFGDGINTVEPGESSDDELTWTLKAAYEINDNFNVFASAATGFKATSWNLTRNSRPVPGDVAALTAEGLAPDNFLTGTRFAGPEESTVFELGLKSRFEKGAFNITAFDQSIEGFQAVLFVGTAFNLITAGEQSVRGLEFDGTYTPIESLTFNLAGAYLDAEYDDFQNASVLRGGEIDAATGGIDGIGNLTGERPAGIPEFAFSVGGTYSFDLTDSMDGYLRADFQWEDETTINDNVPADVTREVAQLNLAAGLNIDENISLQIWARNVTNDEFFNSGFPTPAQAGSFNFYPNQPRTYGAVLRYNF